MPAQNSPSSTRSDRPNRKFSPRKYQNLTYIQLQSANKQGRSELRREDQKWLKTHGYKNVGWDHAIALSEKIAYFKLQYDDREDSLEELFLEADRIGNKYQTPEEIAAFQAALATEVNAIADLVDQQFPDTEIEIIDYGTQPRPAQRKNASRTLSAR
jgi:hypothetical protein